MTNRKSSGAIELVKTVVYALVIAWGIRTVAFEPFNIPSGSMKPTLLIGDFLFVSKYAYGYSTHSFSVFSWSPDFFHGRIFGKLPERGDVVVFKTPRDNSTDFIKRVIGLPGDRVQVTAGQLYVNGEKVERKPEDDYLDDGEGSRILLRRYLEILPGGREHDILKSSDDTDVNNTIEFKVPDGYFFAMGDNRDNSADSRMRIEQGGVGFVPLENLVGRAEFIFLSVDGTAPWWQFWEWPFEIRWSRLFSGIH